MRRSVLYSRHAARPAPRRRLMPELPTGTVIFLFTDIEGSTSLWERHGEAMRVALARHDELLGHAIEFCRGRVFKTVGDAFCAAFPTAPDALAAALEAQRLLREEPWGKTGPLRVRMALHAGAAEERGGDYYGTALNRVARLLSAGHGGQVLVSASTQELARDHLPAGAELRDMGEHRLKDLIRPERVYQLESSDLPHEFPALRTLETRPNNLPLQPSPFIGRERELEAVGKMLRQEGTRLLTLTGPGGTGKTRLALQAAADAIDDLQDGVYFVDLAPLIDPALVPTTIASALGVTESGATPILDTLREYLRDKQLLLVLDNFEQVVEAAGVVSQLLAASPKLKVVVTSRMPLRVGGEREYPVPSLSTPKPPPPPLHVLSQYDAVRLFIERAQGVRPDFELSGENAPAVAEICHRLDGLPLAIELAAVRIRLFPPQTLLSRLGNRLKLLTGGARDASARQRTLRATIDWSYDLMGEQDKALFARLSVFVGGRSLEAMEAVCDPDGELDVLSGVESLIEKSLLRQEEGVGGEPRYAMLETIQEYAGERLEQSGQAEELRRRHAEYFLALAEEAESQLWGPRQVGWLDRLEEERDNLRAALAWSIERDEHEPGLRLAWALWRFWQLRSHPSEGRSWLKQLLARSDVAPPRSRAKALLIAGDLALEQGDGLEAVPPLERAAHIFRAIGDDRCLSLTLATLAIAYHPGGRHAEALPVAEEALQLAREAGDDWAAGFATLVLGNVTWIEGDPERGELLLAEGLSIAHRTGDRWAIGFVSLQLAGFLASRGDYERAAGSLEEACRVFRELGARKYAAAALLNLALVSTERGDYEQGSDLSAEGLALVMETGNVALTAYAYVILGAAALGRGDGEEAATRFTDALALFERAGDEIIVAECTLQLGRAVLISGDTERAAGLLVKSLELRRGRGDKWGMADCLEGCAMLAAARGRAASAARLWAAAGVVRESLGTPLSPNERRIQGSYLAAARGQLGDVDWATAREEGQAMTLERAVEYALWEDGDG